MERIQKITYKGKEILFCNYEGLRGDELLATIKTAIQTMLNAKTPDLLVLANFTNTYVNDEIIAYLTGTESKASSKNAKKIAAVGITGIKKLFFNMYNAISHTSAKACNDLESAKEYLIS